MEFHDQWNSFSQENILPKPLSQEETGDIFTSQNQATNSQSLAIISNSEFNLESNSIVENNTEFEALEYLMYLNGPFVFFQDAKCTFLFLQNLIKDMNLFSFYTDYLKTLPKRERKIRANTVSFFYLEEIKTEIEKKYPTPNLDDVVTNCDKLNETRFLVLAKYLIEKKRVRVTAKFINNLHREQRIGLIKDHYFVRTGPNNKKTASGKNKKKGKNTKSLSTFRRITPIENNTSFGKSSFENFLKNAKTLPVYQPLDPTNNPNFDSSFNSFASTELETSTHSPNLTALILKSKKLISASWLKEQEFNNLEPTYLEKAAIHLTKFQSFFQFPEMWDQFKDSYKSEDEDEQLFVRLTCGKLLLVLFKESPSKNKMEDFSFSEVPNKKLKISPNKDEIDKTHERKRTHIIRYIAVKAEYFNKSKNQVFAIRNLPPIFSLNFQNWNGTNQKQLYVWIFDLLSSVIQLVQKDHPFNEKELPPMESDAEKLALEAFEKANLNVEQFALSEEVLQTFLPLNFFSQQTKRAESTEIKQEKSLKIAGIDRVPIPTEFEEGIFGICKNSKFFPQETQSDEMSTMKKCRKAINKALEYKRRTNEKNKFLLNIIQQNPCKRWEKESWNLYKPIFHKKLKLFQANFLAKIAVWQIQFDDVKSKADLLESEWKSL